MKKVLLILLLLITAPAIAKDFTCSAFGKTVPQIPVSGNVLANMGVSGGIAISPNGIPTTLFDKKLLKYSEEFRNQVLAHECSHHQLGHVHNSSKTLSNKEQAADCRSIFLLQSQLSYSEKEIIIILKTIRNDVMSDPARVANLQSCSSMEDYYDRRITRR